MGFLRATPRLGHFGAGNLGGWAAAFLGLSFLSVTALADPGAEKPGLVIGGGRRSVGEGDEPPAQAAKATAPAPAKSSQPAPVKTHQVGRKPKVPKATVPDDVPLSSPKESARHAIASGPTAEELAKPASDQELDALSQAERVLFPEKTRGITAGFSFGLFAEESAEGALGLPLSSLSPDASDELSDADAAWLRSLTLPDLPVQLDQRVVTYLKFYRDSHRGRTIAAIWAKKSGRYVAAMKSELRRAGLPTDLVWLSMIESGHNPTIQSPAGAMGLWQFMPQSGRMYGLVVDRWVDERRDPARSTQAAIRFLSDLHQRFGNWELAMGAYNMGYAGMSRAISKYNTNDYWTLSRLESGIPWETTLYVPKIFALAVVMNNRQAFGLGRIQEDPAVAFETILVEPATPLDKIAKAAGVSLEDLKKDNPQYLSDRLPPSEKDGERFRVSLPVGSGAKALSALSQQKPGAHKSALLRLGESLDDLAEDWGVSLSALKKENHLGANETVPSGTRLLLPSGAKASLKKSSADALVVSRKIEPGPDQKLVFYRIGEHDDLGEIALAFGVRVDDLARWNALSTRARLREGMSLVAVVPKDADLSRVRYIELTQGRPLLVAGSVEFHEYFEGLGGKRRVEIPVRSGDTLSSIGRHYGMSVGSMERVNRRSRQTKLVIGEKLVVYTNRSTPQTASAADSAELPELRALRPDLLPGAH